MLIMLHEDAIEEMTYHTEDPETIYNTLLGTMKPEVLKFIEHVIKKKSHYPKGCRSEQPYKFENGKLYNSKGERVSRKVHTPFMKGVNYG